MNIGFDVSGAKNNQWRNYGGEFLGSDLPKTNYDLFKRFYQ